MADGISDPANYREMLKPFPDIAAAEAAAQAFHNDVRELRKKHKIPDVVFAYEMSAMMVDGKESVFLNSFTCGSQLKEEYLAAFAFGQATSRHSEMVARALERSRKEK